MRRPARRLAATVLLSTAAVLLGACSSGTPEAGTARACERAEALDAALASFDETLSDDAATVDDVRDARRRVEAAQDAFDDAAEDVARDRVEALDAAWERLDDAVDGLDGDADVAVALDTLRGDAAAVREARDALVADLDC